MSFLFCTCFRLQTDIFKIVSNTAGLMLLRPVAQALAVCLSALSFCYHRFVWRTLSSCLQSSEQDGQKRTELGNWKSEFIKNCVCFHLNVEEFVFSSNWPVSQVLYWWIYRCIIVYPFYVSKKGWLLGFCLYYILYERKLPVETSNRCFVKNWFNRSW